MQRAPRIRAPDRSVGRADRRRALADEPAQARRRRDRALGAVVPAGARHQPGSRVARDDRALAGAASSPRGRREPGFGWLLETNARLAAARPGCWPTAVGGRCRQGDRSLAPHWARRAESVSSVVVDKILGLGALVAARRCRSRPRAGRASEAPRCSPSRSASGWRRRAASPCSSRCAPRRWLRPACGRSPAKLRIEGAMRAPVTTRLHAYREHPGALAWVFLLAIAAQLLRVITVGGGSCTGCICTWASATLLLLWPGALPGDDRARSR